MHHQISRKTFTCLPVIVVCHPSINMQAIDAEFFIEKFKHQCYKELFKTIFQVYCFQTKILFCVLTLNGLLANEITFNNKEQPQMKTLPIYGNNLFPLIVRPLWSDSRKSKRYQVISPKHSFFKKCFLH